MFRLVLLRQLGITGLAAVLALAAVAQQAAADGTAAIHFSESLAALSGQEKKSRKSAGRQLELVGMRLANTRGPRVDGSNVHASSLALRFSGGTAKKSAAFETKHLLAPEKDRCTRRLAVWFAGDVTLDSARAEDPRRAALFTNGVAFGVDARLSPRILVGNAVGAAFDRTRFTADGSQETYYLSNTLYGSLTTSRDTYLDVALGASGEQFASRYGGLEASPTSRRAASQLFGQARYSREFKRRSFRIRSYGQAKLLHTRLGDYVEKGDGAHLHQPQSDDSVELTLGMRGETSITTSAGRLSPHAVFEVSQTAHQTSGAVVASLDGGSDYHLTAPSATRSGRLATRTGLNWAISDHATFKGEYSISTAMAEFRPKQKVTAEFKLKF